MGRRDKARCADVREAARPPCPDTAQGGREDAWVLEHPCWGLERREKIKKKKEKDERSQRRVWEWDLGLKVLDFSGLMTRRVQLCWDGLCRISKPSPPSTARCPRMRPQHSTATAPHWHAHTRSMFLSTPGKFPIYYPSGIYTSIFFLVSWSQHYLMSN